MKLCHSFYELDHLKKQLVQIENRGFDVNHRDPENVTVLHWAAINNRIDIVKYLLLKGPCLTLGCLTSLGHCDAGSWCQSFFLIVE